MAQVRSAGIVIFRRERSKVLFLLLHYPSGHWDFVKGKMEKGESVRQTAIREAEEETGISDVAFVKDFEEQIRYEFQHNSETIRKKVVFFLGETRTSDVLLSHEHQDYVWADYHTAMRKVTYDNAKRVLARAHEALGKRGQK